MLKFEVRIAEFIEKHIIFLLVMLSTILGFLVRLSLKGIISGDYTTYLQPWYEEIKANGLSKQVGNYNLVYQFIIWIFTKINIKPLIAYKIVSCVFDWLLALVTGTMVWHILGEKSKIKAALAYCAVWMSPIVALNSAGWAQCDSIYVTFGVLAILLLSCDKDLLAFVVLGGAFAFKLQAIFVVPVFLLAYVVKKRFSIFNFVIIPVVMIILSLPVIILGGAKPA